MQEQFVFAGFGGQGVMFVGQLLAYTAMDEGLEVTWIPSYGPEMRGGTAHCTVTISDKPIGSPLSKNPKVSVVFNNPSFDKYEPKTSDLLVYNSSLIDRTSERVDLNLLPVPASEIADDLGNMRLMNMVMIGALLTVRPIITLEQLERGIENHIPAHRRNLIQMNYEALRLGETYVAPTLRER